MLLTAIRWLIANSIECRVGIKYIVLSHRRDLFFPVVRLIISRMNDVCYTVVLQAKFHELGELSWYSRITCDVNEKRLPM